MGLYPRNWQHKSELRWAKFQQQQQQQYWFFDTINSHQRIIR